VLEQDAQGFVEKAKGLACQVLVMQIGETKSFS